MMMMITPFFFWCRCAFAFFRDAFSRCLPPLFIRFWCPLLIIRLRAAVCCFFFADACLRWFCRYSYLMMMLVTFARLYDYWWLRDDALRRLFYEMMPDDTLMFHEITMPPWWWWWWFRCLHAAWCLFIFDMPLILMPMMLMLISVDAALIITLFCSTRFDCWCAMFIWRLMSEPIIYFDWWWWWWLLRWYCLLFICRLLLRWWWYCYRRHLRWWWIAPQKTPIWCRAATMPYSAAMPMMMILSLLMRFIVTMMMFIYARR